MTKYFQKRSTYVLLLNCQLHLPTSADVLCLNQNSSYFFYALSPLILIFSSKTICKVLRFLNFLQIHMQPLAGLGNVFERYRIIRHVSHNVFFGILVAMVFWIIIRIHSSIIIIVQCIIESSAIRVQGSDLNLNFGKC